MPVLPSTPRRLPLVLASAAGAWACLAVLLRGLIAAPGVGMAPLSAALILLLSGAVLLALFGEGHPAARRGAVGLAILGALVSLVSLSVLVTVPESATPSASAAVRILHTMSLSAAVALLGAALAILFRWGSAAPSWEARQASAALALVPLGAGTFGLLGFWDGLPLLYGAQRMPMSLPAGPGAVTLGLALVLAAGLDTWPVALFQMTHPEDESSEARWFAHGPLGLFLLLGIGILVAGSFYLRGQIRSAREGAQREVAAVGDLKVRQITEWYRERHEDGEQILHDGLIQAQLNRFLAGGPQAPPEAEVRGWMATLKNSTYRRIVLFDAGGRVRLSVPPDASEPDFRPGEHEAARIQAGLRARDVLVQDLHRDQGHTPIHMNLWVPLGASPVAGQPARGVLLLMVDPQQFLYPLIQTWPGPSSSAETLLVRREGGDVVFLNELRHRPGTALALRLSMADHPDMPGTLATEGKKTFFEGPDYRGVPVLAALRRVPGTPWFLVAKVDEAEIYGPTRQRVWAVEGILLGLLVLVALAMGLVVRHHDAGQLQARMKLEREKRILSDRYAHLMEQAHDIILVMDLEGRILEANAQAVTQYGYSLEALRGLSVLDLRAPETRADTPAQFAQVREGAPLRFETLHLRADGTTFPVEVSAKRIQVGEKSAILSFMHDITERRAQERELQRMNRLYAALSQVNQAIVWSPDRQALLDKICEVMVVFGTFSMAWIGWDDPVTHRVFVAARHGDARGMLDRITVRSDDSPEGHGAVGTAIREACPCVINDFLIDQGSGPWREELLASGLASIAAFPIRQAGEVRGALAVYASEKEVFGTQEAALLEQAAMDISFALDHLAGEERRREAEAALRSSEEKFSRAFHASPDSVAINRLADGVYLDINDGFTRITGYTVEDVLGPSSLPGELGIWAQAEDRLRLQEGLRRDGMVVGLEAPFRRKDGTVLTGLMSASLIEVGGEPCVLSITRDITELRAQARQLERLTQMYAALSQVNQAIVWSPDRQALLDKICEVMVVFGKFSLAWIGWNDPETHEVRVASRYGDATGYLDSIQVRSDDTTLGRGPTGTAIREGRPCVVNDFLGDSAAGPWHGAAVRSGHAATAAFPIREQGEVCGALMVYSTEKDFFGTHEVALLEEASGDVSFALDHLELEARREQAEAALEDSEGRFRTLADTMAGAVFIYQGDRFLFANRAFWGLTGFDPETLGTLRIQDVVHPEDWALVLERSRARLQGEALPARYDFRIRRKDGQVRWVDFTAGRSEWEGQPAGVGTAYDITDRKQTEGRLRELSQVVEQSPLCVMITDLEGRIEYVNPCFTRVTGYTYAEAMGQNPRILKSPHTPKEVYRQMWEALTRGEAWVGEWENLRKDGEPFYERATIAPVRDASGAVTHYIALKEDITADKKAAAERQSLEAQLHQSQKLESLGSLAGGVAHDMNNVLGAILSLASTLREKADPADPTAKSLDTIMNACTRGRGVVKSLLYFAHKDLQEERPIDLNDLVREMSQLLGYTTLKRVRIEMDLQEGLGLVRGDAGALSHALMNLCVNACDAMPGGGTLRIQTATGPEGGVLLRVQDTGEGMGPEVLAKAMEPFFTTKPQGKGTGLGLSMVYGTMTAHEGTFELHSQEGQGTEAILRFPASRVEAPRPVQEAAAPPAPVEQRRLRILLVDDDDLIRESVTEVLKLLGHEPMAAPGGQEALRLLEDGRPVDLLILDMNMPGMTGAQALPRLLALRPDLTVLMSTGYSEEDIAPLLAGRPQVHSIRKPFSMKELKQKIEELGLRPLDGPAC